MSLDAFRWAKTWPLSQASQKFVLIALADFYNDEQRRAWPSMESLAKFTCLSRATIARSLDALKAAGIVEVERWVNADTSNNLTNRYYLPWFDPRSTTTGQTVYANVYLDEDGNRVTEEMDWPTGVVTSTASLAPWPDG